MGLIIFTKMLWIIAPLIAAVPAIIITDRLYK